MHATLTVERILKKERVRLDKQTPVSPRHSILLAWTGRIAIMLALAIPFLRTSDLPAGFSSDVARTHISIDGVDFGYFHRVEGLEDLAQKLLKGELSYTKLQLKRDFVTEPSLYVWAKNHAKNRESLKNIRLVMENEDGEPMASYALKLCQPLAWSLGTEQLTEGGFNETVDIAVREIVTDHIF